MIAGLRRAGFLLILLVLWECVARFGPWPPWIFPGPMATAVSLGELARTGTLWPAIGRSLARLAVGYAISVGIGVPLGLLIGRNRLADEFLGTPIMGLQALPSITWLPVALLWFGLSETAILFVVVVGSVLSIAVSAEDGVRNLDPLWVRAALTLGSRGWRLYWTVLLPASLPAVLAGAKLGWSFAWRSLMAAELLFVSGGLGQLLQTGRELNDVPRIFAVMVAITCIGFGTEKLMFAPAERAVRRRFGTDKG